jgi:serine/threonine-protein kinase
MNPPNREREPSPEVKESALKTFLTKLKKRHIIETLAAFIGGGWLLLEFVHWLLVDHYHFPEKTIDVAFVTILGALLCTLIWRWFSGREGSRKFKLEFVLIPLVALITILLDVNLLLHLKGHEPEAVPAAKWKNSIAVLPFIDTSPQRDQEWFCDGITDEIIGRLSNISELKVSARTSVFYFKGKEQDIREIGQKLGVATVLEGSIQKVESRLRTRVQLITIADGFHVWSEEYDRELKDVFAIQDEIALAVVDKLKLTLLADEKEKLSKHLEINPAAYEEYLKGLFYYWQWSDESILNSILHFRRAVEIEPDYAPAHAGIALAYIQASTWIGLWRPQEGVPKGIEAAQKAIELDPVIADAYVAMGYMRMNFDWDWAGAEKDFKKALELNPHSPLALDGIANLFEFQRRFIDAIAMSKKALELDPLSPALHHDLGANYSWAGEFDRAISHFRKALELDRNFLWAHPGLGMAYLFMGRTNEAMAEFEAARQLASEWPWGQAALGYAYGASDRSAEAIQVLADLEQLSKKRYVSPFQKAYVYLGLGKKDTALDWLEKACEERDGNMPLLNVDQAFDPLRNEPRFQALLKKVGLQK